MNTANPDPPDPKPILTALIDAFNGLEPILRYGGLITVLGVVILWLTGVFPEIFLLYPALALVVYLFYALYNRHLDYRDRQLEYGHKLEELREEHRHIEATTRPKQEESETSSNGQTTAPPVDGGVPADEWQRQYMEYLVKLCGYPPYTALIDIREAGFYVAKIKLERLFTNLDVPAPEHRRALTAKELTKIDSLGLDEIDRRQREPVLKALSRHENKRLVILGAPGSGKSTLLRFLTLCLAGGHLQRADFNQTLLAQKEWALSDARLVPVLIDLAKYAADGLSKDQDLWSYIEASLAAEKLSGYAPHLKEQFRQRGILLLDGLDEVDNAVTVRQALKKHIEQFARRFGAVRIVVTGRPYAYGAGWELDGFGFTRLLAFDQEQINTFIEQWYTAAGEDRMLGADKASKYAEELKAQVNPAYRGTHKLRELARNPLLLTMMVHLHRGREGGKLPERRDQLYALFVSLLLELWQKSKAVNLLEKLDMKRDQLEKALQEAAYTVHMSQPALDRTADITGTFLAGMLHKYRGQESSVDLDGLIKYLRDRAGLLQHHHTRVSEEDDDLYRFAHRTFQEYLAGRYLLRTRFPTELVTLSRRHPNQWREVLLLTTASQREAPNQIWLVVDTLCPVTPPADTSTLFAAAIPGSAAAETQSGAFLAGQVLAETEYLRPELPLKEGEKEEEGRKDKRERVRKWHRAIVQEGLLKPPDRAQAGDVLAELGDDRPGVLTCDAMGLCYVPAGEFWLADDPQDRNGRWFDALNQPYWLGQYPVTVAHFRHFVQDSGHEPAYGGNPLSAPDNRPVAYVNWYDALAFCDWLHRRWRPHLPPGYRVTLPNEAEWEKAARGGREIPASPRAATAHALRPTLVAPPAVRPNQRDGRDLSRREYPWGDEPAREEIEPGRFVYRANDQAGGIGRPSAVGAFPAGASPVGCLDMAGNVWEWTRSFYDKPRPYRLSPEYETADPRKRELMLLCGGAYYVDAHGCSARYWYYPGDGFGGNRLGFRVVVSPFVSEL